MSGTARVFVSYRRQDARHVAGRLADRLVERFEVFMDMDTIEPGTDFTDVIRQAVEDCDVFLSVIGPWTTVTASRGSGGWTTPADWVVAETGAALQRDVPVIPVLVDGAAMPAPGRAAARARCPGQPPGRDHPARVVQLRRQPADRRDRAPAGPCRRARSPSPARRASPTPVAPAAVDTEYSAALAAFFAHRWDEAIEGFERVLRAHPEHAAASERLAEARRSPSSPPGANRPTGPRPRAAGPTR